MITPTTCPQTVQRIAKDQSPDELDKLALGYAIYHWITGVILLKTGLFMSMYINYVLNLWCMIWVIIHFHLKHFFNIIIYFSNKFLLFLLKTGIFQSDPNHLSCSVHYISPLPLARTYIEVFTWLWSGWTIHCSSSKVCRYQAAILWSISLLLHTERDNKDWGRRRAPAQQGTQMATPWIQHFHPWLIRVKCQGVNWVLVSRWLTSQFKWWHTYFQSLEGCP